ncbi:MAG TPA: hypothetical protein VMV20_03800 [Chitinophagaceae bacterium]|nr:hypothetical protein [Chitinophagaceae bacterium]
MPSPQKDPLEQAAGELGISLPAPPGLETARQAIAVRVAWLASHEPGKLRQILYRLDIAEKKLEGLDPGRPDLEIASLIIQRQMEKAASREKFRESREEDRQGEDRW